MATLRMYQRAPKKLRKKNTSEEMNQNIPCRKERSTWAL